MFCSLDNEAGSGFEGRVGFRRSTIVREQNIIPAEVRGRDLSASTSRGVIDEIFQRVVLRIKTGHRITERDKTRR